MSVKDFVKEWVGNREERAQEVKKLIDAFANYDWMKDPLLRAWFLRIKESSEAKQP